MTPGEPQPLLEIRLFGPPSVFLRGAEITHALPRKAVLLLALLALRQGKPESRIQLASQLWPDATESAGLHSLLQMLAKLRRELGDARGVVQAQAARSISLNLSREVSVDLLEFDAAATSPHRPDLERATELYRESLLAGCHEPFAALAREVRQQAFLVAAEKLAHDYLRTKDHSAAIAVLRRIVAEDPYRETACRALMATLAAGDQWPTALEAYRDFRARFRRDLRADVGPETKELYRAIRQQSSSHPPHAPRLGSLPAPITSLIGRKKEIEDVLTLMQLCRLVTLAGPGGVGKTRLAIAVAKELDDKYLDGAHFIDLVAIRDSHAIPPTIAAVLKLPEAPGQSRLEAVAEHVAPRELLLVLDNCEHLSQAAAEIAEKLLFHASGLRILATSRQSLGVRGEHVWSVPVLNLPQPGDKPAEIAKTDSAKLFLALSRRRIGLTDDKDLAAVGSICRRLDGLPLAIELAAARTNLFSPAEIERRLDSRFSLLSKGKSGLDKHQTLHACMEWSWDLLSEGEKDLLMAMSTFRGGASLAAVASVAPENLEGIEDRVGALIDKSLVMARVENGETRYSLLDTVREFAEEKLENSGREAAALDLHRDYFLHYVEEGYRPMNSVDEARKFAAYELEHDNHLAAIAWSHRQKDRGKAIRMCAALSRFWDTHGHLTEGRAQLEFALSHEAPGLPEATLSRAWVHLGWMATVQGECDLAVAHYRKGLAIAEKLGDRPAVAVILTCVANAYLLDNQHEQARGALQESLEIVRESEATGGALILCNLAEVAFNQGNEKEAERWLEETATSLGRITAERATTGGTFLRHKAYLAFRKGDFPASHAFALESLKLFQDADVLVELPITLLVLAFAEGGLGNWVRAVNLIGACEHWLTSEHMTLPSYLSRAKDESLAQAARRLSPAHYEAALQSGRAMSIAQAADSSYALRA